MLVTLILALLSEVVYLFTCVHVHVHVHVCILVHVHVYVHAVGYMNITEYMVYRVYV